MPDNWTLGLSEDEMKLIEQSRIAYLEKIRQKELRSEEIVGEDIEEEMDYLKVDQEVIEKKLKQIRTKPQDQK